jgi:outer membrane protein TolC
MTEFTSINIFFNHLFNLYKAYLNQDLKGFIFKNITFTGMFRKTLILFILIFSFCFVSVQGQELDFYIQKGIENSPLLKDYQNQIQSGLIDSAVLSAERKPQVNGQGQLLVAPTYSGWGYDNAVTNGGNYLGVVNASQIFLAKKIYEPQYEAIRIQKESIGNTSKISEHDLKKSITDQYIIAYSTLNQLSFTQKTYELLKDEELILHTLVEKGAYKQTDYLSFKIVVQSQEIQIKQLLIQYKTDKTAIPKTFYYRIYKDELSIVF